MNTKKIFYGFFAIATLMVASCTSDTSDSEIYESGVDKRFIKKSGSDSVDKRFIKKSGSDSVDKRFIKKSGKD
ncbi:MAG: hypothetical protein R3356_00690 [Eudoraea sp.]|nr:hypothetical protein [Eudoraea sp.]